MTRDLSRDEIVGQRCRLTSATLPPASAARRPLEAVAAIAERFGQLSVEEPHFREVDQNGVVLYRVCPGALAQDAPMNGGR